MKLSLYIIILLILLQNALAITLNQNGIEHYHGREIKVIAVKENQAIIGVDDERSILNDGEIKIIKGVRIEIIEIFYSNELSSLNLNLTLAYECGDGKCSEFESYENCCEDCECEENKQCVSNECIIPECFNDKDCDDNDDLSEDKCEDYKCEYKMVKCRKNSDCNDNYPDTDDFCVNARCKNIQNYVCKTNIDCDDQNPCSLDLCINKDCQYKEVENCKKETVEKSSSKIVEKNSLQKSFFKRLLSWIRNLF